jgi:hypothetical protein
VRATSAAADQRARDKDQRAAQHLLFGQVAEPAAVEPEPFKSHNMVPFTLVVRPMTGRTGQFALSRGSGRNRRS